jgi:hypothetical protein
MATPKAAASKMASSTEMTSASAKVTSAATEVTPAASGMTAAVLSEGCAARKCAYDCQ